MGGHHVAPNPHLVANYPDVYLTTGLVAENHARESRISREAQDAFALRSHQRAIAAIDAGRFADEIVPVGRRGHRPVGQRTARRAARDASTPTKARAATRRRRRSRSSSRRSTRRAPSPPATRRRRATARAAVLVMSRAARTALGLTPLARCVGYATAGVEPERFGIGPGAGDPQAARATEPVARRHRPRRAQRGVRRAGARVPRGAADRSRSAQRQRRRHRARPSARLHRRPADDDARARDGAAASAVTAWSSLCVGGGMGARHY